MRRVKKYSDKLNLSSIEVVWLKIRVALTRKYDAWGVGTGSFYAYDHNGIDIRISNHVPIWEYVRRYARRNTVKDNRCDIKMIFYGKDRRIRKHEGRDSFYSDKYSKILSKRHNTEITANVEIFMIDDLSDIEKLPF